MSPSPPHLSFSRSDRCGVPTRSAGCVAAARRAFCGSDGTLDPVKLCASGLLFEGVFSNKYVVKEIFCEGYAASLGD